MNTRTTIAPSKLLLILAIGAWLLGFIAFLTLTTGGPLFLRLGRDVFMEPHLIAGALAALLAGGSAALVCVVAAVLAIRSRWPRPFVVPFGLSLCYLVLFGGVIARAL